MSDQIMQVEPAGHDESRVERECRARRPWWQRALIGAGITLAVLVIAAFALYRYGSMWVPSQEVRAEYEQLVASGQAEQIEARFHIPIPGCVCHSDDPVRTMEHSTRRISECMECHGGG